MEFETKYINNIPVFIHKTKKIKNIVIRIKCIGNNDKSLRIAINFLSSLLCLSSKKYHTKNKYFDILSKYYEPSISTWVDIFYDMRVFNFNIDLLNGKYFNDFKLLDKVIELSKELFFNLKIENEELISSYFNEKKTKVLSRLYNYKNDKFNYINEKARDELLKDFDNYMCHDEIVEDYKNITPHTLYLAYKHILNLNKYIYVVGDVDDNIIDKLSFLGEMFTNNIDFNFNSFNYYNLNNYIVNDVKYFKESTKNNQSVLSIAYCFNGKIDYKTRFISSIFDIIFASASYSRLFKILREENSLCYSIDSNLNLSFKYYLINVGIDKSNYELTKKLIFEELDKFQNGEISDDIIEYAINESITSLELISDYPPDYINYHFGNLRRNINTSIEDRIGIYKSITKQEIVDFSKRLILNLVYFLEGNVNE